MSADFEGAEGLRKKGGKAPNFYFCDSRQILNSSNTSEVIERDTAMVGREFQRRRTPLASDN